MKKKVIGSLVLVILVVSIVGYYEYSAYGSVVVSTTVVTGKITNDQASGSGLPGGAAGGLGGIVGGLGGGAQAPKPASTTTRASTTTKSTTSTASGLSFITIAVGTDSFTQILSCGTNAYYAGMTVQVADQLLRNGAHQYAPDVACKGAISPFKALYPHGYTSTTSTSTTTT